MNLGDLEFHLLTDGTFRLDGGAMFGVIPKPHVGAQVARRRSQPHSARDEFLLIRAAGKWILVETGAGDKWDAKRQRHLRLRRHAALARIQLAANGVAPEKIDIVINTHLHFDHCGWNTRVVDGKLLPTFPNATLLVQRGELEHAKHPTDRDRASYFRENFDPIEDAGQWHLLDDDAAKSFPVSAVVRLSRTHAAHARRAASPAAATACSFLPIWCPRSAHLAYPWIMGFDLVSH